MNNGLDIDECLDDPCDINAECTNSAGSFSCKCGPMYTGNGTVCIGLLLNKLSIKLVIIGSYLVYLRNT